MNIRNQIRAAGWRRTALAVALGMSFSGIALAQSTTGSIFGQAPVGETVLISSQSGGASREVAVDANGRYSASNLPVGTYTVTLRKDGAAVAARENVFIKVGAGTEVSFTSGAQNAQQLEGLTVTANALPAIDVTSVNSSTIITAQDLKTLPLVRNAESIALLAPGTVAGSGYFGNAVSFGGSSVTENAYYVNGYNTSEPYRNTGGFQLPYGAIEQQETLTGGYSAKYGRSDGGVINQVGKRGTNEWHFGGMVAWQPRFASASPNNLYYVNKFVPDGYGLAEPDLVGTLKQYREDNKKWETIYSAYLGGPLIKDKLYFFLAADQTKDQSTDVAAVGTDTVAYNTDRYKNVYTKLDWNITDNHILELTYLQHNQSTGAGSTYDFDNDTHRATDFETGNDVAKDNAKFFIGTYTGYLTDDLTLSVTYGKGKFEDPTNYNNNSVNPYLLGVLSSNPAYWQDGNYPHNDQTNLYKYLPAASNKTHGLRADLNYKIGDHDIGIGIDNMHYEAKDQGQTMSGPGYAWIYSHTSNPSKSPNPTFGIAPPGGDGYYVQRYVYSVATSMSMDQKAYYLQDIWNITDRFQLNLGVRNDHFTNYNDLGKAFIDEKNQWEPRVGFSWDVNGDSTFKLYGNAGRYYLALPDNVAERAANRSTYTREYFTYTGIDPATGAPTGLTSLGPITSADAEYGQPKDPRQVSARDLKAQYQDEFILGFDKTLGPNWVYGAKATLRNLRAAIDDNCDVDRLADKVAAMGLDPNDYSNELLNPQTLLGCRIFNPGQTNTFDIAKDDGSGYTRVKMSKEDWGFTEGAKRKYYALSLYLEHPFDGKWQGRIDYTFAKSYGNTEGQVKSDIGQADVSKTQDWDSAELMEYSSGLLANDRRHSLRFRGSYQITPEWLVSGTLLAQSGSPRECYGYYGQDNDDPLGYLASYHFCYGQPSPPGKQGHTPWTEDLSLGVHYSPAFADHKLGFHADVFNVLNQQRALQVDPTSTSDAFTISNTYGDGLFYQTPRYVRLSVTYDF